MEAKAYQWKGLDSLPKAIVQTPQGIHFDGFPEWKETKAKKKVLSLSVSLPLGGTLFPLSVSINGIGESLRITENRFSESINGWKLSGFSKRTKSSFEIDFYFFRDEQREIKPPKFELVKDWKSLHSPFVGKYRVGEKVPGLFGQVVEWRQRENRLTDNLILEARLGNSLVGYFSTNSPDVIGIDIDFHNESNPWTGTGLIKTVEKYDGIISAIGMIPSVVYRSPRGIHLFYKFEMKAPWELLAERIRERLSAEKDLQAEILPSPNSTLRIDPISSYIDPMTLEAIEPPKIETIRSYSISELFGFEEIRDFKRPQIKRKRSLSLKRQATLENLEERVFPIRKSNTLFSGCPLLPAYYKSGLSIEQALERVQLLLVRSSYQGELNNTKRLEQRLKSAWANFQRKGFTFSGTQNERQLELRDLSFIETVVNESPFSNRRKQSFKVFLENLIGWIRYHQNLTASEKEWWSFFYTYRDEQNRISGYRIFTQKGWIPIPSTLLWKQDRRYKEFLDWLSERNILKATTGYSVEKSQCRYFQFRELIETRKFYTYDFLEELRKTGLTQKELGQLLEVPQYTISRLLLGQLSKEKMTELEGTWRNVDPHRMRGLGDLKEYAKTEKHI